MGLIWSLLWCCNVLPTSGLDSNLYFFFSPLMRIQWLNYATQSITCKYKASSSIDDFFWTFKFADFGKQLEVSGYAFNDFPQQLTITCDKTLSFVVPTQFYMINHDATTIETIGV